MGCFTWDSALETGDRDIDTQHRSLFALANALHESVLAADDDPEIVTDGVYRLTDYAIQHFADEEALMERCGYPGVGPHRSLHQHLTAETMRLTARYIGGDDMLPTDLAPFVANWLREHIRVQDMAFVAFAKGPDAG